MNSENMVKTNNRLKIIELFFLFLFLALYVWNISHYFWTLPAPSDPLQYLGPMVWKSTYAYWPWLDRLTLAIGLRVFSIFIPTTYLAGPAYIGFINILTILISCIWVYRGQGFLAAVLICIFFNTSFFLLGFATYIYPAQTEAFFALLAFIVFFADENSRIYRKRFMLAGIFSAFAVFSKITGIFAAFYFLIYFVYKKEWKGLRDFIIGSFLGTLIVFVLFIALFNIQSFNNILYLFFKSNQWSGRDLNNLVSFLDQILSVKYFPVFISLFIATSAYKETISRRLFCFAWANIAVIYFIYTFTHRGGSVISTYIYSAYIFAGIGLAATLGSIFADIKTPFFKKAENDRVTIIGVALLSFILICVGLVIGRKYPAVRYFNYSYLYYKPFDVFVSGHISIPEVWRWLFTLGPILVLLSLLLSQISKSKTTIILFMLITSLWGAAFNGGLAYQKAKFDRHEAGFFYEAAPVLNEVPNQKFSIFVRAWNKHPHADRLLWVYRQFFDKKYPRGNEYDSQYKNDIQIREAIDYIKQEKDLVSIKGKQILTDDLITIKKFFPTVKIVKEIGWKGIKLYVVDVSLREPSLKLNFDDWNGTRVLNWTELSKFAPPLKIGGIRGSFSFERVLGDENILKIIPGKPDKNNNLLIQLSLVRKNTLKLNDGKSILISADIKMASKSKRSEVFIQDKVEKWDREKILVTYSTTWNKYRIYKRIRDNASDFSMGIYWDPIRENETLEIKNVLVYVW